MLRRWTEAILQNIAATVLVALIPGAVTAYLTAMGCKWTSPLLLGIIAATLSSLTLLILRKQIGMPVNRVLANEDNIEGLVRQWLSNFRVGVKNEPNAEVYLKLTATMDSESRWGSLGHAVTLAVTL